MRQEPDGVLQREVERLGTELDDVRHRLAEAEERLDFAERLLTRQRQSTLGPGE
jgi:hypothetical protein